MPVFVWVSGFRVLTLLHLGQTGCAPHSDGDGEDVVASAAAGRSPAPAALYDNN